MASIGRALSGAAADREGDGGEPRRDLNRGGSRSGVLLFPFLSPFLFVGIGNVRTAEMTGSPQPEVGTAKYSQKKF